MSRTKRTQKQRTRWNAIRNAIAATLLAREDDPLSFDKAATVKPERASWTKNWGNMLTDAKKAKRFRNRMRAAWIIRRQQDKRSRRWRRAPKHYGARKRSRR